MAALVTLFWNICILRVGPESVPARVWFILVLLIADMAVALLYHHILQLHLSPRVQHDARDRDPDSVRYRHRCLYRRFHRRRAIHLVLQRR
ncbi:MAG: hypothetical protein OXH52_00125 [Gammaproteobacteria bacterium]|nr:hypothetical protein [Gammaproteobacteria bacterium]